jgi:hypothetical protein
MRKLREDRSLRLNLIALLLISSLAIVVYFNSLNNQLTFDDEIEIVDNPLIREAGNIREIFTSESWEWARKSTDVYRPLVMLTYLFNYRLGGLNPFGFHLLNLMIHILISFIIFRFTLMMTGRYGASLVAALIFALHPVHTENVSSVAGRKDLLSALFFCSPSIFTAG